LDILTFSTDYLIALEPELKSFNSTLNINIIKIQEGFISRISLIAVFHSLKYFFPVK